MAVMQARQWKTGLILILFLGIILLIELSGFAEIFMISKQLDSTHENDLELSFSQAIVDHSTTITPLSTSTSSPPPLSSPAWDWFNASSWPEDECPYFENVCFYNQRIFVFDKKDQFYLRANKAQKVFGNHMNNAYESLPIYQKIMNASVWDESINEFERAHCKYDNDVMNHMIVGSFFQSMLGEWYVRVLTQLYAMRQMDPVMTEEIKLYLFIGDQTPLYTSHYLFLQPFSRYNVRHFTELIERIDCNCYHRLIFCGFHRHFNQSTNEQWLEAASRLMVNSHRQEYNLALLQIYPRLIEFYNSWVNLNDLYIHRDSSAWKYEQLTHHFGNISINDVDEWFFIGFYQRHYRRTWLELEKVILPRCNAKYNALKIYCTSICLEDHLHSRDVVVMHRAFDMLIGIHGAHLTDAIWMHDNARRQRRLKYVIELLPTNGPQWTASIKVPTALGIIFWQSRLNHVGIQLSNTSISEKDWKRGEGRWYKSDFKVQWERLRDVIEYLIIDDGGFCKKYSDDPRQIKVPVSFKHKKYHLAIYNAYCNGSDTQNLSWNFVTPQPKYDRRACPTCGLLTYDADS